MGLAPDCSSLHRCPQSETQVALHLVHHLPDGRQGPEDKSALALRRDHRSPNLDSSRLFRVCHPHGIEPVEQGRPNAVVRNAVRTETPGASNAQRTQLGARALRADLNTVTTKTRYEFSKLIREN